MAPPPADAVAAAASKRSAAAAAAVERSAAAAAAPASGSSVPSGAALMHEFLAHSPFVGHLGMRVVSIQPDAVRLAMPYRPDLATMGDLVHGGAISALVDTAATTAAWSAVDLGEGPPQGSTVGLTVDFVAPARGDELTADAIVRRRGRQLCFCDVDVADSRGRLVARGLVTYKLGGTR